MSAKAKARDPSKYKYPVWKKVYCLGTSVSKEVHRTFNDLAYIHGKTIAEYLRELVERAIDEHKRNGRSPG